MFIALKIHVRFQLRYDELFFSRLAFSKPAYMFIAYILKVDGDEKAQTLWSKEQAYRVIDMMMFSNELVSSQRPLAHDMHPFKCKEPG
jgi:hypothetical protein